MSHDAKNENVVQTYRRSNQEGRVAICSPYAKVFGLLRDELMLDVVDDRLWEEFGPHSLPSYFGAGIYKFQEELKNFGNVQKRYTLDDEQQLTFMLESLIHSRRLLLDLFPETLEGNVL
ncbi:hypothetical protein H0X32_00220 [Patescibacteria group bacterium]|nr:hypothetical protein [Patescibacteria group bacterium]